MIMMREDMVSMEGANSGWLHMRVYGGPMISCHSCVPCYRGWLIYKIMNDKDESARQNGEKKRKGTTGKGKKLNNELWINSIHDVCQLW